MICKVSVKWLTKKIDCTYNAIASGCMGKCCKGMSFYPSKAHIVNGHSVGYCYWLGGQGCSLEPDDKPIKCLLYPMVINKDNRLVLHGRALLSLCKKNYNTGNKTIIANLADNLATVFGTEVAVPLIKEVTKGNINHTFRMPVKTECEIAVENYLEVNNIIPVERSEYRLRYPEFFNEHNIVKEDKIPLQLSMSL